MNHVHKGGKDLVSVIITMGTNISIGDTVFNDGLRHTYLRKQYQFLKCLHGRVIMGAFEICFHEGSLWRGHREVISFILKTLFL